MFDWNSFKWCCSSISLSYDVFHVRRSSVVACLNYSYSIKEIHTQRMRICDCVATYRYTQYRILSIWLNVVSTIQMLRTHNNNSEWWKKLLNLFPYTQYSRFTATEQVLGIVIIIIHSLLLLLPLLLPFGYCYFSTSTHTQTYIQYCYYLYTCSQANTLFNGLSCSRRYNSIPIQT